MTEKKVLIIAYYFPPMGLSGVQRTLKFVKYLPDYGWKPVVLTTSSKKYYALDETLEKELSEDRIAIYRTDEKAKSDEKQKAGKFNNFPSYIKQKIGRIVLQTIFQPDSKRTWLKSALKKGAEAIEKEKPDIIFATAPPFTDFLAALKLADEYNLPFIVDYRDIWIDNPFHFFATPFHKSYSVKLENEILKRAKKAIVTARKPKETLIKRYRFISHEDVEIIPHGFDPEDFAKVKNVVRNESKFVVTHSGLFQDNRTPKYFLKAVAAFLKKRPEAKKRTELRFLGLMRKSHKKLISRYNLDGNARLFGYLPHIEAVRNLLESDLLWFTLNDSVRTPGKLYEYIGARKPILALAPEGAITSHVANYKASAIVNPKNVSEIESALERFYSIWKNNKTKTPQKDYVQSFDRKALTGKLSKIFEMATEIK